MEINDGQSEIAGRKIQLDTATARKDNRRNNNKNNKGGGFNVDGSKFRGGRFKKGDHDNHNNKDAPAERTTLKLAPRSKPREGEESGASPGIFGGAKARDEGAWEKKKLDGGDKRRNNQNKGRGGGRGGNGRGEGGRGEGGRGEGGRGGNKHNKKNHKKDAKPQDSAPKAEQTKPPASKPEPAKAAPAGKKAPVNSFALLMDSDSE